MATGFRLYDSSGSPAFEATDRITRVLWEGTVVSVNPATTADGRNGPFSIPDYDPYKGDILLFRTLNSPPFEPVWDSIYNELDFEDNWNQIYAGDTVVVVVLYR